MSRFYCIIPGLIGQEVGSFVVCVGAIPAHAQEAGIGGDDGVRCKTARFRLSLILYARILKQVDLVKTQFTSLVYVLRLVWMCPQILFCGLATRGSEFRFYYKLQIVTIYADICQFFSKS